MNDNYNPNNGYDNNYDNSNYDDGTYGISPDEEDGGGLFTGKLNLGNVIKNIPRDWGHRADPDYYGSDKINLSNFRFQLLSLFFSALYMVYYRAYFLFLILTFLIPCLIGFVTSLLGGIGDLLGPIINITYSLFLSIGTTEMIRWARVKKSIKLEEKGLSDEEVAAKLSPSMKPVVIVVIIYALLILLIVFSLIMAIVAGLTLANMG